MRWLAILILNAVWCSAMAETLYVDDAQKFVWTRTGPSTEYRVGERVVNGKLQVLRRNQETGFVQVRDEKAGEYWIKASYLTQQPSALHQLVAAEARIEQLEKQSQAKIEALEKQLSYLQPLEAINQELQNKLAVQKTELEQAMQNAQMYQDGFESEATVTGAIIIVFGMLLGWLLTRLGSNKRKDGWN